jgi:hypothetical protein
MRQIFRILGWVLITCGPALAAGCGGPTPAASPATTNVAGDTGGDGEIGDDDGQDGGDEGSETDVDLLQGCLPITGGDTQFSSTCSVSGYVLRVGVGCAVGDGSMTIDGDGSTYGTLHVGTGGAGTVRATAQDGVVFPAGSLVGMLHSIAYEGNELGATIRITLRTYEEDVLQEEFVFDETAEWYGVWRQPHNLERVSYETTRQYDAVELSAAVLPVARPASCYALPPICYDGGQVVARVHEFCSN